MVDVVSTVEVWNVLDLGGCPQWSIFQRTLESCVLFIVRKFKSSNICHFLDFKMRSCNVVSLGLCEFPLNGNFPQFSAPQNGFID